MAFCSCGSLQAKFFQQRTLRCGCPKPPKPWPRLLWHFRGNQHIQPWMENQLGSAEVRNSSSIISDCMQARNTGGVCIAGRFKDCGRASCRAFSSLGKEAPHRPSHIGQSLARRFVCAVPDGGTGKSVFAREVVRRVAQAQFSCLLGLLSASFNPLPCKPGLMSCGLSNRRGRMARASCCAAKLQDLVISEAGSRKQ